LLTFARGFRLQTVCVLLLLLAVAVLAVSAAGRTTTRTRATTAQYRPFTTGPRTRRTTTRRTTSRRQPPPSTTPLSAFAGSCVTLTSSLVGFSVRPAQSAASTNLAVLNRSTCAGALCYRIAACNTSFGVAGCSEVSHARVCACVLVFVLCVRLYASSLFSFAAQVSPCITGDCYTITFVSCNPAVPTNSTTTP
jgi:hypothetical protein